jgi:hypothetical protein
MVTKMKREDFKDLQSLQENIVKKDNCSDCTPVHFSEATAFKFNNEEPYRMHVKYFYYDIYSPFIQPPLERKNIQHRMIIHSICL